MLYTPEIAQNDTEQKEEFVILALFFPMMAPGSGQGGGGMLGMLLPFILIFVIMYFFMIRPQVKKQKQHQQMLQALQKGDRVMTSGGIYGKITGVKEKSFLVQISDNTKVEISKTAVAQKIEKSE